MKDFQPINKQELAALQGGGGGKPIPVFAPPFMYVYP